MNSETKHLLKWQFEWAVRFFRTWYHILNRKAYKKWKDERNLDKMQWETDPMAMLTLYGDND